MEAEEQNDCVLVQGSDAARVAHVAQSEHKCLSHQDLAAVLLEDA